MTDERRIIYVVNSLENDAPTRITASVATGMKDRGYNVKFFAWSRGGPLAKLLQDHHIDCTVLGGSTFGNAKAFAVAVRAFQPHIVQSALARPNLGVLLSTTFQPRRDYKWIAVEHGIHEWLERGKFVGVVMQCFYPAVYSMADLTVAVSGETRRELVAYGVPTHKVAMVANGVNVQKYYPRNTATRLQFLASHFPSNTASDTFLIGSAGNLKFVKGYDILLKAIPAIISAHPAARFIIWGRGEEQKRLEELTTQLGITKSVYFAGFEPHLERWLPLLDAYVQPSRAESFGLATAEAMSCGIPPVVSRVGGLTTLVQDGVSGLHFASEDHFALAKQVVNLILDKRLREKVAQAARLRILQSFSRQGMINASVALYNDLLEGSA